MLNKLLLVAVLSIPSLAVSADDFAECRQLFPNGRVPVLSTSVDMRPRPLCFSAFAILHSGKSRTPIYVAERLNRDMLLKAQDNERSDEFYADARLPRSERSELQDYQGSGFDRGHMAPAGDMATTESMAQSFSLANIVPQHSINNRKAWVSIEKATRKYVMRAEGDVFVFTGPVYAGSVETIGANRVWVPRHFFKLVYDPSTNRSWAHWLDNLDDAQVGKPISYEELVNRTGIMFLPDTK